MEQSFIRGTVITPHDTNPVTVPHHALHVGLAAGDATTVVDLVVRLVGNSTNTTFNKIPAGIILPIKVKLVLSTGTTASLVVTALERG